MPDRIRDWYLSHIARKAWPGADVFVEETEGVKNYVLIRPGKASMSLGAKFNASRAVLRELVAEANAGDAV